jgi:4-hydroxybenzoate polyprenyltransferase
VNQTRPANADTLTVDLDRDLLHGNLSAELFWWNLSRDVRSLRDPRRRRVPNPARFPFDPEVVAACKTARAAGKRTVLTYGDHPELGAAVIRHLGCFDATEAGTARPAGLPARRSQGGPREILRQMRPHQWVKNVLVFLPVFAAHAFTPLTILQALLAFLAFGLVASSVYTLNDLSDLDADRRHRTKRNRPFASGRLPVRYGGPMMATLLIAGFAVGALATPALVAVLALYFILTTAYSMALKGMLAVDIIVLAMLYTMRIVAGAAATGIVPSVWLLSFSIFLFLSLAAVKRLAELVELDSRGGAKAAAGRAYTVEDRPIIAMLATAAGYIAVLVLALYLDTPEVRALYDEPAALWGVGLVLLLWITRIVLLAHRGLVNEDPVVFALTDRASRIGLVACAVLFAVAALA